ncbi:MAG: right-handed parallel beta-helix repeat-containing protein [Armatimonadetes bacterium]|nr:right-handed parallel beta-helix repeat-containing protein [Armatimonadota bacterium]
MIAALCLVAVFQADVYVGVQGQDSNPGTDSRPMRTIMAAVRRARELKAHRVVVGEGEYRLLDSIELGAEDSGLVIEAGKNARPMITGCVDVAKESWMKCRDRAVLDRIIDAEARGKVWEIDLGALIGKPLPAAAPYGFTTPVSVAGNELFADDKPMTVARWPNEGFAKVAEVVEPGNGEEDQNKPPRKPVFVANSDRPKLWAKASDVWLYGYWKFDWADESILADSIGGATGRITLSKPHSYGVTKGADFFAENLLEELDRPGEYFVDRVGGMVYFIPPDGAQTIRISALDKPLIRATKASKVVLRDIDLAYSRGDGIRCEDCVDLRIEGCQMYNLGERGAVVNGGRNSGLYGCNVWNTGEGGVTLSGGDRKTLTPAGLYVENCNIHDFQRRTQTYRPAVSVNGVGNIVRHCALHDAPHSAIIYGGNDHLFELNRFYRTLKRTGDGGVVYTGRDWTARGTIIRNNYFFDNIGMSKWEPAIYFDDLASGLTATGNVIERCHWGFLIGGGRDNVITNNVIVDCKLGFDCDARGLGWAAKSEPTMMERLKAVPYEREPWKSRYPQLLTLLANQPMAPMGNVLKGNLLVRSGKVLDRTEAPFQKTALYEGNIESSASGDWEKIPGAPKVPIGKMGLVEDKVRRRLPGKWD